MLKMKKTLGSVGMENMGVPLRSEIFPWLQWKPKGLNVGEATMEEINPALLELSIPR